MKFIAAQMDEAVAAWVMARNPLMDLGDIPYTAIGQLDGSGQIIGGTVFTNFTLRDIHLHVAGSGPRWLTRRFLGECFRYVFFQLNCRRCTVMIAASNQRSIDFCEGLGWRYEGILRAYLAEDEDCLIYGMLREECRWLTVGELQHGHSKPTGPAAAAELKRRPKLRITAALRRVTH